MSSRLTISSPAPGVAATPAAGVVRGDAKKLTQAITNVLSNAYKYSPGGGAVELGVVERSGDGGEAGEVADAPRMLGIRIADRGIGMTPEQLARVCERFYRADTSGKIPGTGLGMSIVREIVELHGGLIDFESAPGAGTTVTLWLPMSGPEAGEAPVPQAAGA